LIAVHRHELDYGGREAHVGEDDRFTSFILSFPDVGKCLMDLRRDQRSEGFQIGVCIQVQDLFVSSCRTRKERVQVEPGIDRTQGVEAGIGLVSVRRHPRRRNLLPRLFRFLTRQASIEFGNHCPPERQEDYRWKVGDKFAGFVHDRVLTASLAAG
jgi:hypothetical protein